MRTTVGVILAGLTLAGGVASATELRVGIQQGAKTVRVGASGNAVVTDGSGRTLGTLPPMLGFVAQVQGGQVVLHTFRGRDLWVRPTDNSFVFISDDWYRGRLRLVARPDGLLAVNHVPLEEYLYSVVGSEMYPFWPLEALKAQAVAARSFILFRLRRPADPDFDVGRTVTWQAYKGYSRESDSTREAVTATTGQVVTYRGQIIEAVYHAASGGHTENVEDIWSAPRPYLRGVPDFDQEAPVYSWQKTFTQAELSRLLPGVGQVTSLTPVRTTPQGRVVEMRVTGTTGTKTFTGSELRRLLDLRSTLFQVTPTRGDVASTNPVNAPDGSFEFQGRGFGHGLGMSQWGAFGLAQRGYNYQQILQYYYQGTEINSTR
ncbi:SpoIID/LytB domain-containing protein [Synechococcus sp. C9]|uniref:SpoIID/LytB domain-containing protein n=1 Tax=Synechococcus sp. C9 TaxID=102119 RepID=UPI001FF50136|nr:SpoIID/LytB domain-containing protein [Synechococcus sp. C9]